nr:NADH dehydrogenase subunit 3 [Haematomyzus cf. elephantis RS460]
MISVTPLIVVLSICLFLMMISGMFTNLEHKQVANEPFECGMDVFMSSRTPFSLHSYLLLILFVIFDIELIVSIPLVFSSLLTSTFWSIMWSVYALFMLIGLTIEIWLGGLSLR